MFAWYADLTVCNLVQSEIACSNVILWIKSISSPFWWCFIWRVRISCWWWGGWVSSAFFHAFQHVHTSRKGATSVGLIYLQLVGSGWSLFLRGILPAFDVLQPLFRVTAEKKDMELNLTLSHIVFPLTYLLLDTASVRKVHVLQTPQSEPNRENSSRVVRAQRRLLFAKRYSSLEV